MLTVATPIEPNARVSKHFPKDGGPPVAYDAGRFFRFTTFEIPDFQVLSNLLRILETRVTPAFVVPGQAKKPGIVGRRWSARKHGERATLLDVPSRVLCFDFDRIQGFDPFQPDAHGKLIEHVKLPAGILYRVVWSASTGVGGKVGAHVWAVGTKPLSADQRRNVYEQHDSDLSVASPTIPIYVQPPTFEHPLDDPFFVRDLPRGRNVTARFLQY